MSDKSPLLLLGVGGAGAAMARGVCRAFGDPVRCLLADTDAASMSPGTPFVLLGGDRLSGHGSGGDVVQARLATEESLKSFDEHLEGVSLAVVLCALGGGTGGGAALEISRHLVKRGIATIVFATTPFQFEGEDRQRRSRGVISMIADTASSAIFLPLDKLIADEDRMDVAMQRAIDTLAGGVTLFWRLLERPGYIRLDAERIRRIVASAGRGRFATVTVRGDGRAADAVAQLARSPLLASAAGPVNSIVCGILAGEDLRLSEVGEIAEGVRDAFGRRASFDLATVNDERTFSGRLCVVLLLFESGDGKAPEEPESAPDSQGGAPKRPKRPRNPLAQGPQGRGRFNNVAPTVWQGEDIDTPTYIRRNISLDV